MVNIESRGGALPPEITKAEQSREPIEETQDSISYLGVRLDKAKKSEGVFVPRRETYEDYINEPWSLELQKKIATSLIQGEPLLIEGGTSIGKTETVKKMCAELGYEVHYANLTGATDVEDLMGRYIPNPNRRGPKDPEFVFADGKVTSGLRQEEGKVKVILLDELNAAPTNILIRLHEVRDAIRKNGDVILSEDASEKVTVDRQRTKLIALQNPPGKGFMAREPLDPAQLRRWVYQKEVTDLPKETFEYSTKALFSLAPESKTIPPEAFAKTREFALTPEQLAEIPGINEMIEKYQEFHRAAKELVKERKLAADQPQPFTYDDREEPRRVRDFVLRFYNGDINESFQEALRYFYANKLETKTDREKLEQLIEHTRYEPKQETKRRGIERSTKKEDNQDPLAEPEIPIETKLTGALKEQVETAREQLGKENVLGPEEVEKTFGIRLKEIPAIPFSATELERAEKLGQMLVLRVDKTKEGKPLSLDAMQKIVDAKWEASGKGALLNSTTNWKTWLRESYSKDTPRAGWALTSKDVLPGSTSKNYIQQTELLVDTLKKEVFAGRMLPEPYAKAIAEFEAKKADLTDLVKADWEKAAKQLSELELTQLVRPTAQELIYDLALYLDTNDERLLGNMYSWTSTRRPDGRLVHPGRFGSAGVRGLAWLPGRSHSALGVSLSRRS